MKNLRRILEKIESKKSDFREDYYIPAIWNSFNFTGTKKSSERDGEINVNPYEFISYAIENCILSKANDQVPYLQSIIKNYEKVNLSESVIYSMLPRMFTCWDHYGKDQLCSGTFLKAISLLPYLKKLNVDIIYLLPIFEYSHKHKKGELGSPYAIKNIYKLDENLHDDLLGKYSEELLEIEFKAFMEACHVLGIKVMIDFVFRTCARDNDFITQKPEWFYWILNKYNSNFCTPHVCTEDCLTTLNDRAVKNLYGTEGIEDYFVRFTDNPRNIDQGKWNKLVKQSKKTGENILDLVEQEYGITTVPGFSDVINDPQPPWTDVTFYRFYFDVNSKIRCCANIDKYPPYILQDAIKANLYPGEKPNIELWEYISQVIPYYQNKYGIDGARIDMGHALPSDLNKDIISRAKNNNPNFILWSEEFDAEKSFKAKEEGFNFISGCLWSIYPEICKNDFNKSVIEALINAEIPIAAALETPDTPRATLIHNDVNKLKILTLLNAFIPNSIFFINNGFEVGEIQPMNLGLGNTEEGQFVLDVEDSMYGKLAFFDNYKINWLNNKKDENLNLLYSALNLRKQYMNIIGKKENFIKQDWLYYDERIIWLCYYDQQSREGLFLIANKNPWEVKDINFKHFTPEEVRQINNVFKAVYSNWDNNILHYIDYQRTLNPYEVVIGLVKNIY